MEQGLRQGCVFAPLLFDMFFAVVINVVSTRFKAVKGMMDTLVHLRKKRGAGGCNYRKVSPGNAALGHTLCWRCRGRLAITRTAEEMMGVIVVVCAALGLTVSEAKTEIMCLRTKGMTESTATFMAKWIVAEKAKARLRHAVVCPNVRIAQSKRARAGSLALVD